MTIALCLVLLTYECLSGIFLGTIGCHSNKIWCFVKNRISIDFGAWQRTLHVLYLLANTLLQNIANALSGLIHF